VYELGIHIVCCCSITGEHAYNIRVHNTDIIGGFAGIRKSTDYNAYYIRVHNTDIIGGFAGIRKSTDYMKPGPYIKWKPYSSREKIPMIRTGIKQ
jgi:hypothetical protein